MQTWVSCLWRSILNSILLSVGQVPVSQLLFIGHTGIPHAHIWSSFKLKFCAGLWLIQCRWPQLQLYVSILVPTTHCVCKMDLCIWWDLFCSLGKDNRRLSGWFMMCSNSYYWSDLDIVDILLSEIHLQAWFFERMKLILGVRKLWTSSFIS